MDKKTEDRLVQNCITPGNGSLDAGLALLDTLAMAVRIKQHEKPLFAEGVWQALGMVKTDMRQLQATVECVKNRPAGINFAPQASAFALTATLVRFLNQEYLPAEKRRQNQDNVQDC